MPDQTNDIPIEPVNVRIEGTPKWPHAVVSIYDLALLYAVARIRIRLRGRIAEYEEWPMTPEYRNDTEAALTRIKETLIGLGLTVEDGVPNA